MPGFAMPSASAQESQKGIQARPASRALPDGTAPLFIFRSRADRLRALFMHGFLKIAEPAISCMPGMACLQGLIALRATAKILPMLRIGLCPNFWGNSGAIAALLWLKPKYYRKFTDNSEYMLQYVCN
jgi:hypothetical protein